MTINPHPFALSVVTEQRHAEIRALCARERLARCSAMCPSAGQPRANHPTVGPTAKALALMLSGKRQTSLPSSRPG